MGWKRLVGAQVGIFKSEMSVRLPPGNVTFEVGLKSVRSGLKIDVWTASAVSLYSSDTE